MAMMKTTPQPSALTEGAEPIRRDRPIRAGAVSYLNTLPLIEGLGKLEDVELTLTAPSQLIDLLSADRIDVGLTSLIDAQRSPEPLALIPAGMIGCDGPTMTVRLFSSVPLDSIRRLHVDSDSHTSVALAQVLLAERQGIAPEIVEFDVDAHRARGGAWPESVLLIGDKVVTDAPAPEAHPHELDLGAAWHELTGLPFVYAIWMCPARRVGEPLIDTASALLDRQRRHNAMRMGWIVQARARPRGWDESQARHYLARLLRYEVDERARASVDRFFDLCAARGVIEERRPTSWA